MIDLRLHFPQVTAEVVESPGDKLLIINEEQVEWPLV